MDDLKLTPETINDIAEIVAEIWLSGKNDSQVFDYHECNTRQRWVARLAKLQHRDRPDREKIANLLSAPECGQCEFEWTCKEWREKYHINCKWKDELIDQLLTLIPDAVVYTDEK